MTPRQKKFADNYLRSGNATQSAIKAGYSKASAKVQGSRLLTYDNIKMYIQSKQKELDKESIADMEEIHSFWTDVVRDDENLMNDRLRASELFARANGAFLDRVEQSGQVNLKVEWLDED